MACVFQMAVIDPSLVSRVDAFQGSDVQLFTARPDSPPPTHPCDGSCI